MSTRKRKRTPAVKPILGGDQGCHNVHAVAYAMPPLETPFLQVQTSKQDYTKKKNVGPFPEYARPTVHELSVAFEALKRLHGDPGSGTKATNKPGGHVPVLDSLIRTMLSQNTTDVLSGKAFATLKQTFPTWEQVRAASEDDLAAAIQICGLGQIRAVRIKSILNSLAESAYGLSLEYMRDMEDAQIKQALTSFKGVGPKTASCVLIFSLGRADFPVDTHVWRISKKMGWVPNKASREQTYAHMNVHMPSHMKHDLHVLLVKHGKTCPNCAKNGQNRFATVGPCPLTPNVLKDTADVESPYETVTFPKVKKVKRKGDTSKTLVKGKGDANNAAAAVSKTRSRRQTDVSIQMTPSISIPVKCENKSPQGSDDMKMFSHHPNFRTSSRNE